MELLVCDLFSPGMTPLHRAGLGGLVSTLRWIEKTVPKADRPSGQWKMDERSVIFEWENGKEARSLLKWLFALAFQIKEGLIYLPGQYGDLSPPLEVRAALQEGLLLSFYDHGVQSRGKKSQAQDSTYEVDEKPVAYRFLPLAWYKHERDGFELFEEALQGKLCLTRTLFPGAIERHAGLAGTHVTNSASLALPLLFAPIGVLALRAGGKRVNDRGTRKFKAGAALLVPDLHSLTGVHHLLPALLPRNAQDCQVTNISDAALQAELRLRSRNLLDPDMVPAFRACGVVLLTGTPGFNLLPS